MVICMDHSFNANICNDNILNMMHTRGVHVQRTQLPMLHIFNTAASINSILHAIISGHSELRFDVQFCFRHSTSLLTRQVTWLANSQQIDVPILNHPILEALSVTIGGLLSAAADRYSDGISENVLLHNQNSDTKPGRIALVSKGVFPSEARDIPEDDPNDEDETCSYFGTWGRGLKEQLINSKAEPAAEQCISSQGAQTLHQTLHDYRYFTRTRLGDTPDARVEPILLALKANTRQMRTKHRSYPL